MTELVVPQQERMGQSGASYLQEIRGIMRRVRQPTQLPWRQLEGLGTASLGQAAERIFLPRLLEKERIVVGDPSYEEVTGLGMTEKGFTRGDSAHGVFFADLQVVKRDKLGGVSRERTPVAVKRYDNPGSALVEFVNTLSVREKGIATVEPLCVVLNESQSSLVTRAKGEIRNLDGEPWQPFVSADADSQVLMGTRMKKMATLLADLHAQGIFHGDAQLKNFVITPDGSIELLDWESSSVFQNEGRTMAFDTAISHGTKDLESLYGSLTGVPEHLYTPVLVGHLPDRWKQFREHVFDPYWEHWLQRMDIRHPEDTRTEDWYYGYIGEVETRMRETVLL